MKILTIKDYIKQSGNAKSTVYKKIKDGEIRSTSIGNHRYILDGDTKKAVISFVQMKGGVGKTTSAVSVACFLNLYGYKVLLVDLDSQDNVVKHFKINKEIAPKNSYHLFFEDTTIEQCISQTNYENLDIVSSSLVLGIHEGKIYGHNEILLNKVRNIKEYYDFVIFDNSPSVGTVVANSIVASDYILFPLTTDNKCFEGLLSLLEFVKEVKDNSASNAEILGCFLTMTKQNTLVYKHWGSEYKNLLQEKLFEAEINQDEELNKCSNSGDTIVEYDRDGKTRGHKNYNELTLEILKRVNK